MLGIVFECVEISLVTSF